MPMRPMRMATQAVRFRLHKPKAALLLDPTFETQAETIDEQFQSETVILQAQIRFHRHKDRQGGTGMTGDSQFSTGWVTIAATVLDAAGLNYESLKNALITGVRRLHTAAGKFDEVEYQVSEVRPVGHLRHGPILFKAFFDNHKDNQGYV